MTALGRGKLAAVQGTTNLSIRQPWRTTPQTAQNGLFSDGKTLNLAPIDDSQILGNTTGSTDIPTAISLSSLGITPAQIAFRVMVRI